MKKLLIIAGALLATSIVVFVITRMSSPTTSNTNIGHVTNTVANNNAVTNSATNSVVPATREQMLAVARLFAERYGTMTTDNPGANLRSVAPSASEALAAALNRTAAAVPTTKPVPPVVTTSSALSFSVKAYNEALGTGDVLVTLRRSEVTGTGSPRVFNQDLDLSFIKEHGAWKVSVAVWGQERSL